MSNGQFSHLTLSERALVRRKAIAQRQEAQAPAHPLLRLQRQVGNATVERLIAQRQEDEEEMQAKHDPALAQRQEEEEEMAQAKHDPALAQRQEEEEEMQAKHDAALAQREEEEEEMQAKHDPSAPRVGLDGGPVDSDIESRIEAKRGSGAPLDSGVRTTMESTLGTSFEDVRVHQDAESDALNRNITAKAFTTGSDIFLRRDVNPTDTSTVAHEVAHVAQQRTMSGGGSGMTVGAADSSYEHEADAIAAHAFSTPKPEEG
jgi:hypothetical protein